MSDEMILCQSCRLHFVDEHLCDQCMTDEGLVAFENGRFDGANDRIREAYTGLCEAGYLEAAAWLKARYAPTFAQCRVCLGLSEGEEFCKGCREEVPPPTEESP